MTQETCKTCRFYHGSSLTCRRHAPVYAAPRGYAWPANVFPDHYCGEHQPLSDKGPTQ